MKKILQRGGSDGSQSVNYLSNIKSEVLSLHGAKEASRCLDKSSLGGVVKAQAWL